MHSHLRGCLGRDVLWPGIVRQKEHLDNLRTQLAQFPERKSNLRKLLDRLGTDFSPEQREKEARFVYKSIVRFENLQDNVELQIIVGRLEELEKEWQAEQEK